MYCTCTCAVCGGGKQNLTKVRSVLLKLILVWFIIAAMPISTKALSEKDAECAAKTMEKPVSASLWNISHSLCTLGCYITYLAMY